MCDIFAAPSSTAASGAGSLPFCFFCTGAPPPPPPPFSSSPERSRLLPVRLAPMAAASAPPVQL
uniref:Uncharacterized protein n=1 Tax=Arundo donax TaxID=35708 RepID=A0A0A9ERM3_ARUDO